MFFKRQKPLVLNFVLIVVLLSGIVGVIPAEARSVRFQPASMEYVPLPFPTGWNQGRLLDVWGSSASDIYTVGYVYDETEKDAPLVYHNAGTGWTETSPALPSGWERAHLSAVWGSGASDVYAAGSGINAAGAAIPLLYHNDGTGWTVPPLTPPVGLSFSSLNSVWGSSATDVYAAGYGYNASLFQEPVLYHYDGASWVEVDLSVPSGWSAANLNGVWGSGASDVYLVGSVYDSMAGNPLIYHNDGSGWIAAALPARPIFGGIWGSSATDVHLVGVGKDPAEMGIPLHYQNNGTGWVESNPLLPTGWQGQLEDIWGSSASDFYAVGSGYTTGGNYVPLLYHNNGSGWTESNPNLPPGWTEGYLHGVWVSGAGDMYAVGIGFENALGLPLLYGPEVCVSSAITVTNANDSGAGSLRQAIADLCSGGTINFAAPLAGQTIVLASTLVIDKDLTIDGSALSPQIHISGNNSVSVFEVPPGISVTLNGLAIENGNGAGGGGISNGGTLQVMNSILSGNTSTGNGGGGIANFGSLSLSYTTLSMNNATNDGGGIYNQGGNVTLTRTRFASNHARYGGGLNTREGTVTIVEGLFSENTADFGAGIYNFGTITISDSIFYRNAASGDAGAIYHSYFGTGTVTGSLFLENSATDRGGGILNSEGVFNVTNNTFAGNTANLGAGIHNDGRTSGAATLNLASSTLSGNSAVTYGGGVYNTGELNFTNTILANSVSGDDCYNSNGYTGTVNTNSNNLIETNGSTGHACGSPAVTGDPMLGALAENGGFTMTMALLPGSPAIDAGSALSCPATDQRGVSRPQGNACDIGAYEAEVAPAPTAFFLSLGSNQTVGGIAAADEDILFFNGTEWSMFFDGSDVGVGSSDLFAFSYLLPNTILMSFGTNVTVNGIAATPQDILRFNATSLGDITAGTFSMYFDGSDVGLADATNEKIDALSAQENGPLLISTTGNPSVPGLTIGRDEDVIAFTPASLGDATSGTWSLYFDGSDVGLGETSGEDIDALDVFGTDIYLSTHDNFSVPGLSGADEDVFVCAATSLGDVTACTYSSNLLFDGSAWGLTANDVDAFSIRATPPTPTHVPTNTVTPTPTATPSPTPTSPSTGGTFTFTPLADAYVNAGSPTSNYGSSTTLRTDASPDLHSYLRFDVQGLSGAVTKATLRVYANSPSSLGCIASRVDDNTWTEATINYNNAPAVGNALGSSGAFGGAEWINIDVTTYVTGNGAYNLALTTPSSTAISLASSEAGANAPQLIIETAP